ncbi:hypothetical protein BT63DRAFT_409678 [Microthyrium microscopicum]|uniref:Uncharacterized protein n=1 Tax=Microthyrium microscopicum TaxID=703497 RepID=A0A6A6UK38_9PEZI|nr:hypothetical protein BT63DRAFT_409678 [Microthyrium microscopicum]
MSITKQLHSPEFLEDFNSPFFSEEQTNRRINRVFDEKPCATPDLEYNCTSVRHGVVGEYGPGIGANAGLLDSRTKRLEPNDQFHVVRIFQRVLRVSAKNTDLDTPQRASSCSSLLPSTRLPAALLLAYYRYYKNEILRCSQQIICNISPVREGMTLVDCFLEKQ